MEQQFQNTSSVDYSLKEGETIVLQLKSNVNLISFPCRCLYTIYGAFNQSILIEFCWFRCKQKSGQSVKSKFFEQDPNNLSPENKGNQKEARISIKPPPPPAAPVSPSATVQKSPLHSPPSFNLGAASKQVVSEPTQVTEHADSSKLKSTQDVEDDDFGDFQTAGWYEHSRSESIDILNLSFWVWDGLGLWKKKTFKIALICCILSS